MASNIEKWVLEDHKLEKWNSRGKKCLVLIGKILTNTS